MIIRVLTDTAELVTGVKQVTSQLDGLENRFKGVGNAIQVVKATAAFAAVSAAIYAVIEAAQQIDDIADHINDTAAAAQRLQAIAVSLDVDIHSLVSGIQNLQANLGAGKIDDDLARLNIEVAEFKSLAPSEQYIAVAAALAQIKDPADRAAAAKALLGNASKELTNSFRENVAEIKALYTATEEGVKAYDSLKIGIRASAQALQAFGVDLLISMTGMRAWIEIKGLMDAKNGPANAPTSGPTRAPGLPPIKAPSGLDVEIMDQGIQASIAMNQLALATAEANFAMDEYLRKLGHVTEIVPEFMAIADANKVIVAEIEKWSELLEGRGVEAAERLNEQFSKAVQLNLALAGEAERSAAVLKAAIEKDGAPQQSDFDRRMEEINRIHNAKMSQVDRRDSRADATAAEAENRIWEETNLAVQALQMNLTSVTAEATTQLGVVSKVADQYDRLRQPIQTEISQDKRMEIDKAAAAGRYYGPVDDHGMPDFKALGLSGGTTNITNQFQLGNSFEDPAVQSKIARVVEDVVTKRRSESGRL